MRAMHQQTVLRKSQGTATLAKSFGGWVKAADQHDPENREFTAIVSAFDVVDDEGDVMIPGAFADEIERIERAGLVLPVVWNHQHGDPHAHIGAVKDMAELAPGDPRLPRKLVEKGGFWVRSVVDEDEAAAKVHRLMKGGRITQFSFVAMSGEWSPGERDGRKVREIRKVSDLVEVGPTLRGMNTETALLTVKNQDLKTPAPPSPGSFRAHAERRLRFISTFH